MGLVVNDKIKEFSESYTNQEFTAHTTLERSFTLSKGTWMVTAGVTLDQDEARVANDYIMFCLSTDSAATGYDDMADTFGVVKLRMSEGGNAFGSTSVPISLTSETTVYFRLRSDFTSETNALKFAFKCIRIGD